MKKLTYNQFIDKWLKLQKNPGTCAMNDNQQKWDWGNYCEAVVILKLNTGGELEFLDTDMNQMIVSDAKNLIDKYHG